jgi:hypothetical protein
MPEMQPDFPENEAAAQLQDREPGESSSTGEMRSLFEHLLDEVNSEVGKCEVLSLPCCIHLVGKFDFLAVLAKRERLEIRFVLKRELANSRVQRSTRIAKTQYKHCVDVQAAEDIDEELLSWVREAYHLERR